MRRKRKRNFHTQSRLYTSSKLYSSMTAGTRRQISRKKPLARLLASDSDVLIVGARTCWVNNSEIARLASEVQTIFDFDDFDDFDFVPSYSSCCLERTRVYESSCRVTCVECIWLLKFELNDRLFIYLLSRAWIRDNTRLLLVLRLYKQKSGK